jgi:hypothetical protein
MTLEEFKNIISYTTDEQYVKYFDEHILLYEFLNNRFAPGDISIDVHQNPKSITYKIIPRVKLEQSYLSETLNMLEISLFNRNFLVASRLEDGNIIINLKSH